MSSSITSIKTRIKSINSTKKITGAMKSVSTVKLNRMSKFTLKNKEYKDVLDETASNVLNSPFEFDSKYCMANNSKNKLYIVFVSDVGLCGSYNASIDSYLKHNVNKNDSLYIIGTSIYESIRKEGYKVLNDPISSDNSSYADVVKLFTLALSKFENEEVGEVIVLYNKFINSISYKTEEYKVLPFTKKTEEKQKEIILEPNPNEIFNSLLLLFLKSEIYNLYLESKTSEQVARRFAMENATKNAEDLIDDLTLEYNKARQGSITQEITEIVAGANAI